MPKTTRVNLNAICKTCLNALDAATSLEEDTPRENDLSVCIYCGTIAKFDSDMCLTPLSDVELEIIERDNPEAMNSLNQIVTIIRNHAQ